MKLSAKLSHILSIGLMLPILSTTPSLSITQGTVWEDLHIFTLKQCPVLADTMTIEDFDKFASKIYTPLTDSQIATKENFNEETAGWLCGIKHHQEQQNYLRMISSQELHIKPLDLPLLQFDPKLLEAAYCLSAEKSSHCKSKFDFKNQEIITVKQSKAFQMQDKKSLGLAGIDDAFYQSNGYLEDIAVLLLKEAELRASGENRTEIKHVHKQALELLQKFSALQNKIDSQLDAYKHRLDTEDLRDLGTLGSGLTFNKVTDKQKNLIKYET